MKIYWFLHYQRLPRLPACPYLVCLPSPAPDALLRVGGCHTAAMAYAGTNENAVIRRLLHLAVSDVNDDVRRAAVTALGFLLLR